MNEDTTIIKLQILWGREGLWRRVLLYVFTNRLKTPVAPAFRIDPDEGLFSRRETDI